MMKYQQVVPVVLGRAIVKLVPAVIADTLHADRIDGATQVGVEGRSAANVSGCTTIRLFAVTAVVFTVYVVVEVGTTNAPAGAAPQAAGFTEFTAQFVLDINKGAVIDPVAGSANAPAALRVAVAEGVCSAFVPPPVTRAVEVNVPPAVVTFDANTPESVNVQVVDKVVQLTRSPVTGAVAKPRMMLVVVAALPQIVCAAAALFDV